MYVPKKFEELRVERVHALVDAHPLASIVSAGPSGPDADHVPLLLDATRGAEGTLRGHVSRSNPMWKALDGATVLAIFRGPDLYVTPSWYPSKSERGEVVPTWNYAVVHAHGRIRFVHDRAWLLDCVRALTERFERDRAEPWSVDDAPAEFIDGLLGAIVGLEIEVERWVAKVKASQNRAPIDHQGVIDGLDREGTDVARAMRELVARR
jgi:transcriptional regulator